MDVDLALLPALSPTHRDFNRREEARIKVIASNSANAQRRAQMELDAWTEIYTDLKISTETSAPLLSRDLKEACDLASRGLPRSSNLIEPLQPPAVAR